MKMHFLLLLPVMVGMTSSQTTETSTTVTFVPTEVSTTSELLQSTGTTEMPFQCDGEGFYENPDDCSMYYVCDVSGNWLELSCDDGEYFDASQETCIEGVCPSSTTTEAVTTEAPFQCDGEGYYENPDDCSMYYVCDVSGNWLELSCGNGEYFDASQETCIEGVCPLSTTTEAVTTEAPFQCDGEGYYENPDNCSMYYVCDDSGNWLELSCDDGEYFDASMESCVEGVCPSSTTTEAVTTEAPFQCNGEGYYENPDNCSMYYVCDDSGNWLELSCDDGEYFDASQERCVEGVCPSSTTTEVVTTEAPFQCNGEGYYEDPDDCSMYYVCDDSGNWLELSCEGGQYFDPSSETCVDGVCPASSTEVASTTQAVTSATQAPFQCSEQGLFADENDCTVFHYCSADLNDNVAFCNVGYCFEQEILECVEGMECSTC